MCDYTVSGSKETLSRYTAYTYDKQKRLAAYAECDGPDVPSQETLDKHKVSYTYDKDGLVTDIDYAFAQDGITGLRYHYDTNKWLTSISAKGGLLDKTLREYTYDDFGRVSQMVDHYGFADGGNGTITRNYTYDPLGRVTAMTYTDSKDGDQAKETYAYTYDKNSNITEEKIVSRYAMESGKGIDCTKTYTYDKVGRLETSNVVNKAEGTAENKNAEYTYDKVGNRKTEKIGNETTTYAYNGLNQLTEAETMKAGETAAASKRAYTYDRNGNQISQNDSVTGESAALTYDAAGRLSKYEAKKDNAVVVTQENRYNGNGQRIQKKETQGSQAKTRNYYYQSGTVLYTSDDGGKLTSLNLMGSEGNVIATQRKGEGSPAWYLYNKDIRESTFSMINSSGELAAAYEYDEFGNTTVRAGESFDNEICYTGQVYDQSTGLYYYNARFYDPEDGRFVSQDTYRGEQMDPGTWNLYTYCANDPVNYVDPSGHDAIFLQATKGAKGAGHSALLIKVSGKWKYYSWEGDGYTGWTAQLKNVYKGISNSGVVTKNINSSKSIKRVKNEKGKWSHGRPYNKYFYIKGNFTGSYKYAKEQMAGKHYKKYKLTSVNCVWITIQLLRKGKISKAKKRGYIVYNGVRRQEENKNINAH